MKIYQTRIDPLLAKNRELIEFQDAFLMYSQAQKVEKNESDKLLRLVPDLLQSLAFQDSLTGEWCYEYGDPIGLSGLIGNHTFPDMARLHKSLVEITRRLNRSDVLVWCKKLLNLSQHQSALEEMAPIYHLDDEIQVFPERNANLNNNTNADWEIVVPNLQNIFLEVKYRQHDFRLYADEIIKRLPVISNLSKPNHDTDLLFKKLENKFESVDYRKRLQGAWISTFLRQDEAKIRASFNKIHDDQLHFVLLVAPGAKDNAAYLLTRPGIPGQHILDIFNLRHKPEKVFD
jgi:hypothetical protein